MNKVLPDFKKLAIIVGDGDLPLEVLQSSDKLGINYIVICFKGVQSKIKQQGNVIVAEFENIHKLFHELELLKVDSVAFCGYINRPKLNLELISKDSKKILTPIIEKFNDTDEKLIFEILKTFRHRNLKPISLFDLLIDSFCDKGVLTILSPSKINIRDSLRARKVFKLMSQADLGQSLVVSNGLCLAIETSSGTDSMLSYVGNLKRSNKHAWNGGILYKRPKIGQNSFIDLPVIGKRTIELVKSAGLNGIILEANSVIILDKVRTINFANELGLFVWSKK